MHQRGERMENLKKFLSISFGDGSGDSPGDGYDDCCGFGDGDGYCSGDGYGSYNDSYNGSGDGSGNSFGYGSGDGSGDSCGYGRDWGSDVIAINGNKVNVVDGVPTIITHLKNNIAKAYVLKNDLTLCPCYIAKIENSFAHASTIKEAVKQAYEKAFQELPIERRIEEFWKCHNDTDKYPARDLWIWHNKLTGSCKMGRNQFAAEKGIDIDNDSFTVKEFVEMCKDRYGGEIILQLNDK